MAANIFRGDAIAVAQIDTFTPGDVTAGDTFTITINGKSVTYTAVDTVVATVTAALTVLLNASTIPEFAEITWADATTHITGTSDTAGKPFTATSTSVGVDPDTFTRAALVASAGPNHYDTNENWSLGLVPVVTDDVFIENTNVSILYGLNQSAIALTSFTVAAGYTGEIGLPKIDSSGSIPYDDYRDRDLQIDSTTVTLGRGEGTISSRIQLDLVTGNAAVTVYGTGSSNEADFQSVYLKGAGAGSNTLNVLDGEVDIATRGGDTANFTPITATNGSTVICGTGVTLATVNADSNCSITTRSAIITLTMNDNPEVLHEIGAIATANVLGGTLKYNSTDTITTLEMGPNTVLDASDNPNAFIITNATISTGCTISDPKSGITWTNGYLSRGGVQGVVHTTAPDKTVTVT